MYAVRIRITVVPDRMDDWDGKSQTSWVEELMPRDSMLLSDNKGALFQVDVEAVRECGG